MFIWFSRVGYLWTLAILTGSIEISFSKITSSRYSIYSFWNLHFLGCRNSLCLARISSTLHTAHVCSSIDLVKIRMLSRQMTTIPSTIRFQKMLFIIVWNRARLLVILKNIMRGTVMPCDTIIQSYVPYQLSDLVVILTHSASQNSLYYLNNQLIFTTLSFVFYQVDYSVYSDSANLSQLSMNLLLLKGNSVGVGSTSIVAMPKWSSQSLPDSRTKLLTPILPSLEHPDQSYLKHQTQIPISNNNSDVMAPNLQFLENPL